MATLRPSESPFDPVLEIEDGSIEGTDCVNAYYVAIDEKSYQANDSGPSATRDKVLLATVTTDSLRMFPIHVRRGAPDYLSAKYDQLRTITIPLDDDGTTLPDSPEAFEELLSRLPPGFSRQFQYGLGLKWEYRHLISAIEEFPGVVELFFPNGDQVSVDPPIYTLGLRRYDQMRKAIDSLTRRYQREALEDKILLAHSGLLHAIAPHVFPKKTKKVRPGAIFELVKLGAERPAFSRDDRQAAISLVKAEAPEIAKTDPAVLLALWTDIEKITLGTLIDKFDDMLTKDLTESKWQEFLKANPFVLSLAFAYPVFLVQDQAYVGGATIRGAGEKIADFLLAHRYTGNLALIEIKRPKAPLLRAVAYRPDLHAPTTEVSGSISQVLDQKYRLQNSFTQKAYESGLNNVHPYSIQCIVVAGTSPTERDERKSLELFRNATKDVTLITFDELLDKLKEIQRVFSAADDDAPEAVDTDVPS